MNHLVSAFRSPLSALALLACSAGPLPAAHVCVTGTDFQTAPLQGRRVTLTPLVYPAQTPEAIVSLEARWAVTDTNGRATFSNTLAGTYRLDLAGSPLTSVRLEIPDTNGLISARSCLISLTGTNAGGLVAWSATAADARYLSAPGGTNLVTWTNGGRVFVAGTGGPTGNAIATLNGRGTNTALYQALLTGTNVLNDGGVQSLHVVGPELRPMDDDIAQVIPLAVRGPVTASNYVQILDEQPIPNSFAISNQYPTTWFLASFSDQVLRFNPWKYMSFPSEIRADTITITNDSTFQQQVHCLGDMAAGTTLTVTGQVSVLGPLLAAGGLTNNGTAVFTNGNVGLGTNNPQAALHIFATNGLCAIQLSGVGKTNLFTVDTNGNTTVNGTLTGLGTVVAGQSSSLGWNSSSRCRAPADGTVALLNSGLSDFSALVFGSNSLVSTNHPALRKLANGTGASPSGLMISDAANTNGAVLEIHAIPAWQTNNAPSGDCIRLYAQTNNAANSAELVVVDEAGNHTVLSPHSQDAPASFYQLTNWSKAFPTVTRTINFYTGQVEWRNESLTSLIFEWLMRGSNVAALRLTNAVYLCETFAQYNTRTGRTNGNGLSPLRWTGVQNAMVAKSLADWSAASNRLAALMEAAKADSTLDTNAVLLPPVYTPKSIPPMLKLLGAD